MIKILLLVIIVIMNLAQNYELRQFDYSYVCYEFLFIAYSHIKIRLSAFCGNNPRMVS